ncbi:diaminopimelate decarboxylase [bacterium]|jgi:diaminopimelate decarboxylase|nr:diaminopimelate decarboxylase [bacterium]
MGIKPVSEKIDLDGQLIIGGKKVTDLVDEFGTPLYILDQDTVEKNCQDYLQALSKNYPKSLVVFAGKACLNVGLLNILADQGLGVDVVSGGELFTALRSKMNPLNIIFHGNNKSIEELEIAVENNVRIILDNEQELENVKQVTARLGKKARLMIRIKPEIEAHTHEYIKTGQIDSKFGIDKNDLIKIAKLIVSDDKLDFLGIHSHIGSQIFDVNPFEDLASLMIEKVALIKSELGIDVPEINCGGGIGIQYVESDDPPAVSDFVTRLCSKLKAACERENLELPLLMLEPGRSIVGTAGITAYKIGTVKRIENVKNYVFIDGGMADNPRPIMYQAEYTFGLANKADKPTTDTFSIAGKFCESGDILANGISLPDAEVGDVLVVYGTGAYNYSMASNYNRFCRPAMVVVKDGAARYLVKRETFQDLVNLDVV